LENFALIIFLNSIFQPKLPLKLSKLSSKQISYSGVLQSLLNNPNIKVKIADLGNACFDVSLNFKKFICRFLCKKRLTFLYLQSYIITDIIFSDIFTKPFFA
jgi:hypothetical protein